jgi:hypothetical protein
MRTGYHPFRVSRTYWKATSHNPLVVNPISIDAVIIAYILTDAGVCSRGGVVFFDGRWVCRSRIVPCLLSLILSLTRVRRDCQFQDLFDAKDRSWISRLLASEPIAAECH